DRLGRCTSAVCPHVVAGSPTQRGTGGQGRKRGHVHQEIVPLRVNKINRASFQTRSRLFCCVTGKETYYECHRKNRILGRCSSSPLARHRPNRLGYCHFHEGRNVSRKH